MLKIQNRDFSLSKAYPYLSPGISDIIRLFCLKHPETAQAVTEVRLRLGGALSLSVSDGNITLDSVGDIADNCYICTASDIEQAADLLCGSSFHSHRTELEQGYVSSAGSVRAGISTYGVQGGSVWGIDGICIRIPRDFLGCSLPLLSQSGVCPMLIYSPPGVGKTTLLRDIVAQLSDRFRLRVVVCDTKYELLPQKKPALADYICGKEKAAAIEAATRTMSPQVIVCDEIGSYEEAREILSAQSGGVPLIASAHADCISSLLSRPNLKLLYDADVFKLYVRLSRTQEGFMFDIDGGKT